MTFLKEHMVAYGKYFFGDVLETAFYLSDGRVVAGTAEWVHEPSEPHAFNVRTNVQV